MASPVPTALHFALFPLMAQGHLIPMVDIARILALRGAIVTIVTTPVNASRFRPVVARAVEANLKIQIIELQIPFAEFGLPEGCETLDMLSSLELIRKLFAALETLQGPVEAVLREKKSPPVSCIISDNFLSWTMDLARRLNIPRLVFHGPGCFTYLCIEIIFTSNILSRINSDLEYFQLPGLRDDIEFTKPQATCWGNGPKGDMDGFFKRVREAENASYGIVVNSFEELEMEYVEELAKSKGKKVWCIGPVSLCNSSNEDMAERGNKAGIDEHKCLKWLDSKEPQSVLYVCLGSLASSSNEQVIELGLGLELSNRPFIWCIRKKSKELERWFWEEGFEERVKDRSLIIHGWAPQVLILSHRAIGGFLTHCGWNSTLEGVTAGVPMVTWPHFADQFMNEKFITQVLRIGVRIGAEVPFMFVDQDNGGELVKKEDVQTAVIRLMDEGEEGNERRKRARELAGMAKRAMEEGGSSHWNVTSMIHDIAEQLAKNTILN